MIIFAKVEDLKKELLSNKEKYRGKVMSDRFGRRWIIVGIDEDGIKVLPYVGYAS